MQQLYCVRTARHTTGSRAHFHYTLAINQTVLHLASVIIKFALITLCSRLPVARDHVGVGLIAPEIVLVKLVGR